MSKSDLDDCPLLYSDQPHEEELQNITVRSRARNKIRGAARIMSRWPDYWSLTFRIWWLGAGMFFVSVFVVYNCLALSMLTPVHSHVSEYWNIKDKHENLKQDSSTLFPEVFMHLFIQDNEEVDLKSYVSKITDLSNKYRNLTYNLIVIRNDTLIENLSDEENNEIAMNYLLSNKRLPIKPKSVINGINIERVTLSSYMKSSPLNSHWKHVPYQYMEFLVRAISVWDNGGVSFNPIILNSSSNTAYLEKLERVLGSFSNNHKIAEATSDNAIRPKESLNKHNVNGKRIANNIRDVINIMEREDASKNLDINLLEAEDRPHAVIESEQKLPLNFNDDKTDKVSGFQNKRDSMSQDIKLKSNSSSEFNRKSVSSFPDPIFHSNNISRNVLNFTEPVTNKFTRRRKSIIRADLINKSNSLIGNKVEKFQPIIVLAKDLKFNENEKYDPPETEIKEKSGQLTIDIKGNIIATENKCHAFIGAVFNRAIHHNNNDTLTNFIIAELSSFCNGVLSSCTGIDVILV